MTEANKYSILGIVVACLAIAVFSGSNFISAAIAGFNLAGMPRELRLGIDTGLISQSECTRRQLNRLTSKGSFADRLNIMLEQVGMVELSERKGLESSGIFSAKPENARLSRKEAFAAMARICLHLSDKGLIKLPETKAVNYRDYKIPEKYLGAAAFLQNRFVVRGYPDGSLGAGKSLTNREAVYFIYRLYETIAADMMANQPATGIRFVDISLSHPVMNSIKLLTDAGAFNKILLKPAFDGESHISAGELSDMLEGIFTHSNQTVDQIRLKTILPANSLVSRNQLALALEYLLGSSSLSESKTEIAYSDVKSESPEYAALVKLAAADIRLGYQSNYFRGNEKVTWFEAVSALAGTVKASAAISPATAKVEPQRLAQKSDIDALIALIKAKKAKVRQILEYKRPYQR